MSCTYIALLRGVNVGTARRISMADLRALAARLGYPDARTVLNSGNLVLGAPADAASDISDGLSHALSERFGAPSRVMVVSAERLAEVLDADPLVAHADQPSRLFVGFLADGGDVANLATLADVDWSPEEFAVGDGAVYLWCPAGVTESPLAKAVARALGESVTMRNWATVTKLRALAASGSTRSSAAPHREPAS